MLKVIALAAILALASSALGGQLAGPVAAAVTCVTVQPPVGTPFVDCSQGQVLNILPAGNNGLTTATETGTAANGTAPHEADQLAMYLNLKKVAPGMQPSALGSYYKNAGFSVPMSDIGQVQTFYGALAWYLDQHPRHAEVLFTQLVRPAVTDRKLAAPSED